MAWAEALPGFAAILLGTVALFALLPGPLRLGGWMFDFHFMFVASALAILGTQLVVLGLAAKTHARMELRVGDRWLAFLDRWFTLERGLLVGLALLAVSGGWSAAVDAKTAGMRLWFGSRAAGIVAYLLVTALALFGLVLSLAFTLRVEIAAPAVIAVIVHVIAPC